MKGVVTVRTNSKEHRFMQKILIALAVVVLTTTTTVASDKTDVMTLVRQFVVGFNQGDTKTAAGACAEETFIIDEFPPYEWHGAGGCSQWMNDYDADAKKNGISDGVVTLGRPRHLDVTSERAYVVVPANYTAPNSIDAPVVGAFTSPLDDQVEEFVADVEAFSAENGGPSAGANGGVGAAASGGSASGSSSGDANSSSAGGTSGGGSADASASGAGFDAGSGAGSASAGGKAKRGGNRLGQLQALLDVIGTTMPDFLGRYRNLNLLFEGARTTAGLPSWLQTVKGGLAAFRSSTDKSSAAAALAQLVSAADSLKNQTRVAFMQSSFTPGREDAGSAFSSAPAAVGVSAAAPAGASVDSTAAAAKSAVADSIANAAKEAAKKKLGGLLKNPFGKKN